MKKGLVMEGGAMRGLFTCGVIDVFLENDITFDGAIGISAGAVFGCNFISKQHGRPRRYNMNFCRHPGYGTLRSLIRTGDLYDVDLCYREIPQELDVFDAKAFEENPTVFYVGAADVETGRCIYHKCSDGKEPDNTWMRASASMPLVSRIVEVDGYKLLDGGIADSIPLAFMQQEGYERNVVVLTQPKGYIKKKNSLLPVFRIVMRKYPKLIEAMANRHIVYNEQVKKVEEDERSGKVFIIRPSESLRVGRTEKDPKELERVYQMGRQEALKNLDKLKEFMKD